MTENEPIYNLSFERSVLSSLIFEPKQASYLFENYSDEIFYLEGHKDIFNSIQRLIIQDMPIDEEFIKSDLMGIKRFDERLLIEVMVSNPISNIKPYIDELAKHRDRRKLLNLSVQFKKASLSEDPIGAAKELIVSLEESVGIDHRLPRPKNHEEIEERDVEFILKGWLPVPKNTVSLVTAPGGTGKTWLVLQMAARYCMEENNQRAFLWLSEDPIALSKSRLNKILTRVIETPQSGLKIDLAGDATPHLLNISHNKVLIDPIWYDLKKVFEPYGLIILDPLIAFFGGDENNNGHARYFMQLFTEYAGDNGKTIIFIHHSTKGSTGSRGAGAITDAARLHYEIDFVKDNSNEIDPSKKDMRTIRLSKDNYGAAMILGGNEVQRKVFPSKNEIQYNLNQAEYRKF